MKLPRNHIHSRSQRVLVCRLSSPVNLPLAGIPCNQ